MEKYKEYFTPVAILVMGVMISLSILAAGGGINLSFEKGEGADRVANEPTPSGDAGPSVTADDYIRGNPNAPITIVEYSDLECPFCARHHPVMKQLANAYSPDDFAWIYRHFPLSSIHPNAQSLSEASECAFEIGENNGFWAFIDKVFGA